MATILDIMQDASELVHYDEAGIPLYIRTGQLSSYPGKRALCHWHEDLELIRVLEGEMNYYINGKEIHMKAHDGLLVNSRQMHYGYSVGGKDCLFICILFHPSLLKNNDVLYNQYVLPVISNSLYEFSYLDSNRADSLLLLNLLSEISTQKTLGEPGYPLTVMGLLFQFWKLLYHTEHLDNLPQVFPPDNDVTLQKKLVSYIYQHYQEKITLQDLAAYGNICDSKCCKIFKHYLQQSPVEFINTYRLKVSSCLLLTTDKTITEISSLCGFNHLSYYSELFFRYFHCTPREYRKKES